MGQPPSHVGSEGGVVPVVAENKIRTPPLTFGVREGGWYL